MPDEDDGLMDDDLDICDEITRLTALAPPSERLMRYPKVRRFLAEKMAGLHRSPLTTLRVEIGNSNRHAKPVTLPTGPFNHHDH